MDLATCSAFCRRLPPTKPLTPQHEMAYSHPHAYHHIGCGSGKLRTDRHDSIASAATSALAGEGPFRVDLKRNLTSSTRRDTKVDFLLTANHTVPNVTAFDVTISCSLTSTYISAAASSATAIFTERTREKVAKHLPGSIEQGRAFLPIVFNSFGGLGPPETIEWFDAVFRHSAQRERAAGGSGRTAADRKLLFYASVHAALIRATARMVHLRVTATPPTTSRHE